MTTQQVNQIDSKDENVFAEELGTLVFQSALMQYLAEEDEEQSNQFESYIDAHVAEDNFLESLCSSYPRFEELLKQEITILRSELKEVAA